MEQQIRVNRIDGKDVKEWRWTCGCGLEGPWRPAPKVPRDNPWFLDEIAVKEHRHLSIQRQIQN